MSFETTVKKGSVHEQKLPNGDLLVTFQEFRGQSFLGVIAGIILGLSAIIGFLVLGIGLADGGGIAVFVGLIMLGVPVYLFCFKRYKTSSFTIVPHQGIKHKGENIAFKDINTISTTTYNGSPMGFNLDVMGNRVKLVDGARPADITYIRHIFESNSPVKFS
ncbi:MAG: hypothetical protein ACO29Z_08110 [Crocinitomicaceae bacterium]